MLRMSGRSSMVVLAACAALFGLRPVAVRGQVKAWETAIVLPTYEVGPAEPDPIFYSGRAYQGAKGPIYPYALLDRLTDAKRDRSYRILYLENKYVRIGVLPEIGGRIFEAVDKTNGYDFVYRQHVIKPALIGMLGAWISGGVEWNIPHHHRATTFMPVDSSLETSADGSATIWVGEIELRHRMKWLVGLTLRPDSSVLEVTIRLFNRTPLRPLHARLRQRGCPRQRELPGPLPAVDRGGDLPRQEPILAAGPSRRGLQRPGLHAGGRRQLVEEPPHADVVLRLRCRRGFPGRLRSRPEAGVVFVGDHNVVPGKEALDLGNGLRGQDLGKDPDRCRRPLPRAHGRLLVGQPARLQLDPAGGGAGGHAVLVSAPRASEA